MALSPRKNGRGNSGRRENSWVKRIFPSVLRCCPSRFGLLFLFFFLFLPLGLGFFILGLLGALGLFHFELASEQFDDGQIRAVASAVAEFNDAAVAAVTVCSADAGATGRPCSSSLIPRERPMP